MTDDIATTPILSLRQLDFAYPGQPPLLRGVSADLAAGRVTAVLGPNGCGKSTLLKLACGLLRPAAGEVLLRGRSIRRMKPRELARQVALLSQVNHPPEITVEELAAYGRYPHQRYGQGLRPQDRAIVDRALRQAQADAFRDQPLDRLSGGQRQRAYLAMALAQDTELILLDEPTTFLDIHIRFEIMELIRGLNRGGKTVVMVLHDLELALEYADEVILMERGVIRAQDAPRQIVESGLLDEVFHIRTHCFAAEGRRFYQFAKQGR